MDNGVRFVLDNFEKSINLCSSINKKLVKKIKREYNTIKYIKFTGNMVSYFERFRDGKHKFAKNFSFLKKYGLMPNEKISDYLKENYPEEVDNKITYHLIKEGDVLSYAETYIYFGGSNQGKVIRRNKKDNLFVLTLKEGFNQFGPDNKTITFNYQGANSNYDESKYLLKYKELGSTIYVFKFKNKNEYIFLGSYEIDGNPYSRNNIKFINLSHSSTNSKNKNDHTKELHKVKYLSKPSEQEIKNCKVNRKYRNQDVALYTKNRAKGKCDLCGKDAPFKNLFGQPYLECHHIQYIANNGPDRIYNTVALCPNCHKEVHELGESSTKIKLISKLKDYLLEDKDKHNLTLFNELFAFDCKKYK